MRTPLIIADKEFKTKKDALNYYKTILNSYKFGQSLSDEHFNDLIDLLDYDFFIDNPEIENSEDESENKKQKEINEEIQDIEENEDDLIIEDIKIARVQFNTKCFEVVHNDLSSVYISYIQIINRPKFTPDTLFNNACRNTVHKDMMAVKQKYFDDNSVKGYVKCQETNILSNWEDLRIDHRQPNTFSVIVDRFKEVNKIEVAEIEYLTNDDNLLLFKNEIITEAFINYHKEKANLRIVRKECNLSRTGMARIKRSSKDLTIT